MILVDKEIRELTANNQLISDGFNINNLNGVSYDLTLDHILDESGNKHEKYDLSPGETVFIRTKEQLSIPKNILGRIAEKNSRMRQGLKVDGPHYQPGHVTYAYLRVQNISHQIIELSSGIKIAQIFFEQLSQVPDSTYDLQPNASFQNETSYRGLGNYKAEYEQQTKQYIEQDRFKNSSNIIAPR
jgi:deoxycytidine triphosphate deaminase